MLGSVFTTLVLSTLATAHIILTYPGWRGNNLIENDTFPYGMQWMYPCGGMGTSRNRTYWPTLGGAIAFQPGWFQGHDKATLYVNLGFGTDGPDNGPKNMSFPMVPPFGLLGPSKGPYPGTVCLPQVPLPANTVMSPGDNATIQVVELAQHGAALYSCVDITFVEPGDPRVGHVNETNCFNSTDLGFSDIYTITTKEVGAIVNATTTSAAAIVNSIRSSGGAWMGYVPLVLGAFWLLI
ncbi:hypothetical protein PG994_005059 [Apiospora phragmitis]|uniref:Copper acquisition factor BIM1-like domain-containing protein n=1 Tax=Apiospora phragmitis TaxID=2905665 RepID=A0ABR1VSC3_9PEZI